MCPSNLFFQVVHILYAPALSLANVPPFYPYSNAVSGPESRHNVTLLLSLQVYLIGPMKNRSPNFSVGAAGSLCKVSQIFFHVLILNAIYHLAFPSIEDELSSDRAIAMLGLRTFFRIN